MILYSRQKSVFLVMPVDVYVYIVIRNKIRQNLRYVAKTEDHQSPL